MTENLILLLITLAIMLFTAAAAGWIVERVSTYEPRDKPRLCRPLRVKKLKQKEGARIRRIDFPDKPAKEVSTK